VSLLWSRTAVLSIILRRQLSPALLLL